MWMLDQMYYSMIAMKINIMLEIKLQFYSGTRKRKSYPLFKRDREHAGIGALYYIR